MSQHDTAGDDGERSGFGIRAGHLGGRAAGCECSGKHVVQGSVAVLGSLGQWVLVQVQEEEPTDMKGLA